MGNDILVKFGLWRWAMLRWALRDMKHHPAEAFLLGGALCATVTLFGCLLLIECVLSTAFQERMARSPAVVVRRSDAGVREPMPAAGTLARAAAVPGVLQPRLRVRGVAQSSHGLLTVIGLDPADGRAWPPGMPRPARGQAVIGPIFPADRSPGAVTLRGRESLSLRIVGRLPDNASVADPDAIVMHIDDARSLLGLLPDQASDLVLDVFHEDEAEALRAELEAAFPFAVRITTRRESLTAGLNGIARRTGLSVLTLAPALLALALVILTSGGRRLSGAGEAGLLKALGWTGRDILRLHLLRAVVIGVPAVTAGAAAACLLTFPQGGAWVSGLFSGWSAPAPQLHFSSLGCLPGLALAVLIVAVPYLAAAAWAGFRDARSDPADVLAAL